MQIRKVNYIQLISENAVCNINNTEFIGLQWKYNCWEKYDIAFSIYLSSADKISTVLS
jgi:hypothetical protein